MLHWLSKKTNDPPKTVVKSTPIRSKHGVKDDNVEKPNGIVVCSNVDGGDIRRRRLKGVQQSKLSCEDLCLVRFLQRRDISRACFYRTLNLKGLGGFRKRQCNSVPLMRVKRENEIDRGVLMSSSDKADSNYIAAPGVSKVLYISDSAHQSSSSGSDNDQRPDLDKNGKKKGGKMKTISRVKELLRWPAPAKGTHKGEKNIVGQKVLHFKNTIGLKEVAVEDQFSYDSPKISFRWDVESCSATSSAYSAISAISKSSTFQIDILRSISVHVQSDQHAGRTGNWITTDSEFVVLEL